MRQSRKNAFALAGVLALVASAVALVLASIGTAAGAAICTSRTTSSSASWNTTGAVISSRPLEKIERCDPSAADCVERCENVRVVEGEVDKATAACSCRNARRIKGEIAIPHDLTRLDTR